MNKTPYFIQLEDWDKAPEGTIAFVGPSWVLVAFTQEQRDAWTRPIVQFFGQQTVNFNQCN